MKTILCFLLLIGSVAQQDLFYDAGYEAYKKGEMATSEEERIDHFNKALSFYLQYDKREASGFVLFNIANTYFQLKEYGLAIAYYHKARKMLPRDERIMRNLLKATAKAGVTHEGRALFFSSYERKLLLLAFFISACIFFSLFLWWRLVSCVYLASICICACLFFFSDLLYHSFRADEAVVIQTTLLLESPIEQPRAGEDVLLISGNLVEVLDSQEQGEYFFARLPSGRKGYIKIKHLRII